MVVIFTYLLASATGLTRVGTTRINSSLCDIPGQGPCLLSIPSFQGSSVTASLK